MPEFGWREGDVTGVLIAISTIEVDGEDVGTSYWLVHAKVELRSAGELLLDGGQEE